MLIFFFILIFLAELKITFDIVCYLRKLDEKICLLDEQISALNPVIEEQFLSLRIALNKVLLSLNDIQLKIKEKKEEYKIILLKNLITGVLFFILNINGSKILSVVDLAVDIKDFLKKWSLIA